MNKLNKKPLKHIKAQVLTSWSRESNPGCKLLPGNRVKIKRTKQYGKVIAVSTVDGHRITNNPPSGTAPTRSWATYYVKSRGKLYSFNSAELTFAPYYL